MPGDESLLETVKEFFEEDEWYYDKVGGAAVLTAGYQGDNGGWRCYAQVDEDERWLAFYSQLDSHIPEERRPALAEFFARANYGLVLGNFEMDFRDGEVRYKTSINVRDDRLSVGLVRPLVYLNVFTMDRYLPGIMKVAYSDSDPADAIAAIEAQAVEL
jgi:hypothetical protein